MTPVMQVSGHVLFRAPETMIWLWMRLRRRTRDHTIIGPHQMKSIASYFGHAFVYCGLWSTRQHSKRWGWIPSCTPQRLPFGTTEVWHPCLPEQHHHCWNESWTILLDYKKGPWLLRAVITSIIQQGSRWRCWEVAGSKGCQYYYMAVWKALTGWSTISIFGKYQS